MNKIAILYLLILKKKNNDLIDNRYLKIYKIVCNIIQMF